MQGHVPTQYRVALSTPLGWMGILATAHGVNRLFIGHATRAEVLEQLGEPTLATSKELPAWLSQAVDLLERYAEGEAVNLNSIPLDLPAATPFQQRVRQQLRCVTYGQTLSYGDLAAAAGAPKAARAVGTVMARNPVPLLIPCHRVVASGQRLGGFSAPQGIDFKKRLLNLEGASLFASGAR